MIELLTLGTQFLTHYPIVLYRSLIWVLANVYPQQHHFLEESTGTIYEGRRTGSEKMSTL
jgi:hypothetical protein